MKKTELVYREILFNIIEKKNSKITQLELSKKLSISLSTVNLALKPLVRMNSIKINLRNFEIIDPKKILYYWASIRNIEKDILYSSRIDQPVKETEKQMPAGITFTAYSAYKSIFKDVPSDYSEIYLYSDEIEEIKKRFKGKKLNPNLFILKKDGKLDNYGKYPPLANIFVDLWNLPQWYAKDFLKALEVEIGGILEQ